MGKLRKHRRNQKARHNPLGDAATQGQHSQLDKSQKNDEGTRQSKILPLINKLRSSVPNDKSMALGAITVLAEDERMRRLLLKERLIAVVMETCLNDSNDEIIVEAFGLLRNLGVEEGYDVSKYLWRQGIWVSIESALNKIDHSFKYMKGEGKENGEQEKEKEREGQTNKNNTTSVKDKSKVLLLFDFCENVLSLILVLASGDDQMCDAVLAKSEPIVELVLQLVQDHITNKLRVSNKLFNVGLEFIFELATVSDELVEKLILCSKLSEIIEHVENLNNKLTKVFVEGIKFRVFEIEQLPNKYRRKQEEMAKILKMVYWILSSIDLSQLSQSIEKSKNNFNNNNNSSSNEFIQKSGASKGEENTLEKDLSSSSDLKNEVQADLATIENGLAIVASVLEYISVNEEAPSLPVHISNELENVLFGEIEPMLKQLLNAAGYQYTNLQLDEQILSALNNFCWLLLSNENLPVAWYEESLAVWDIVLKVLDKNFNSLGLSTMWAIMKCHGPEITQRVPPSFIENLLCIKVEEPNFETIPNVVGVIGTIAPIANNTEITYSISQYLMAAISVACENANSKNPLAVEIIIESLNALYDIFADKEFQYDYEIFVEKNYLVWFRDIEPRVKEAYKKVDKNRHPVLKSRMEEVWNNLERFIEYKASERS